MRNIQKIKTTLPVKTEIELVSDKGIRDENQDYAAVISISEGKAICIYPEKEIESTSSSSQDLCIAIIADGMGGLINGAEISKAVVEHLAEILINSDIDLEETLEKSLQSMSILFSEKYPGAGSTVVIAVIKKDKSYIMHVGDSRCYISDGKTVTRTADHSPTDIMYLNGMINEEEIKTHPMKNVISNFIGGEIKIEITPIPDNWKRLMLCSDGVHSFFEAEKMEKYVKSHISGNDLVDLSLKSGSTDNITAILINKKLSFGNFSIMQR